MTEYLILSAAEAEALCPGLQPLITHRIGDASFAIQPFPLKGGSYVLPAAVLSDAAHVSKKGDMEKYSRRLVSKDEWPESSAP